MRNKKRIHVLLSTFLLLPAAIILENSDGLETVNNLKGYLKEWIAPVFLSLIISGLIYGIKKALKRETNFLNVYYHTAYILFVLIFLIISIKYL